MVANGLRGFSNNPNPKHGDVISREDLQRRTRVGDIDRLPVKRKRGVMLVDMRMCYKLGV